MKRLDERTRAALRQYVLPAASMLAAYLTLAMALRPFADLFYGGDDWAYGWSVKTLVETGHLRASQWASAAAVPQTFWAAIFVRMTGVHPRTMNLATLGLSTLGLTAIYWLGWRLGLRAKDAAWVGAFVGVGPLFLSFQSSFMSDGYYTTFAASALAAYVAALQLRSVRWALAGSIMAACAFLTRQIGICLPSAFGVTLALAVALRREMLKDALLLLVAGVSLPTIAFGVYEVFPDLLGGRTVAQHLVTDSDKLRARLHDVSGTAASMHLVLLYVTVLSLPIFIVFALRSRERIVRALQYRGLLGAVSVGSLGAFVQRAMLQGPQPFVTRESVFQVHGEFLHTYKAAAPLAPSVRAWWWLCLVASLAFPIICAVIVDGIRDAFRAFSAKDGAEPTLSGEGEKSEVSVAPRDRALPLALLASCLAFHVFLTSSFITFYNNYFLPLVVMANVLLAAALWPSKDRPSAPAYVVFGLTAAASLVMLDSHFRYVEANKRALDQMIESGVDQMDVFPYPTFFAWANYDAVSNRIVETNSVNDAFPIFRNKSHYRIQDSTAASPGRGWRVLREEEYRTLAGKKRIAIWGRRHRS